MTDNIRPPRREGNRLTPSWSIDYKASSEVRGWMEELARTTALDREQPPVDPADIPDAQLLAAYPRPDPAPHGKEYDEEYVQRRWLRDLDDYQWLHMARSWLAIRGGWMLPPPIAWYPYVVDPNVGEGFRTGVPRTLAQRRYKRDVEAALAARARAEARDRTQASDGKPG